jgi:hypothetical protein
MDNEIFSTVEVEKAALAPEQQAYIVQYGGPGRLI